MELALPDNGANVMIRIRPWCATPHKHWLFV
jgi:hypothetical protein